MTSPLNAVKAVTQDNSPLPSNSPIVLQKCKNENGTHLFRHQLHSLISVWKYIVLIKIVWLTNTPGHSVLQHFEITFLIAVPISYKKGAQVYLKV